MNYAAADAVIPNPQLPHHLFRLQRANNSTAFPIGSIAVIPLLHQAVLVNISLKVSITSWLLLQCPASYSFVSMFWLIRFASVLPHVFFGCFTENPRNLPTLQFYFLITTVHQAGVHLERAALCQAYHLIHQWPVFQLSAPHTPRSCRSIPCHSSRPSCGNIRHHWQPVPACVAKIILSGTLGVGYRWRQQLSACSMCDPAVTDRRLFLDIDLSDRNFHDRQEGA